MILEHRVGQGDPAPDDVVRAQLLLVVNGFARGTAGVRLELVEHLLARLNDGATAVVRMLGSIGMADLPANADLAYGVLDGFELAAKEGLALLDHNAFSTGSPRSRSPTRCGCSMRSMSPPRSTSRRSAAT